MVVARWILRDRWMADGVRGGLYRKLRDVFRLALWLNLAFTSDFALGETRMPAVYGLAGFWVIVWAKSSSMTAHINMDGHG